MRKEPDTRKTSEMDSSKGITSDESKDRRRMNEIANEMAKKGKNTEKEYDQAQKFPATGPGGIS